MDSRGNKLNIPCASYLLKVSVLELPWHAKMWTFLQCNRLWKLLLINSSNSILHSTCFFLWMTDCHIRSLKKFLTRVIQHMKKVDHVSSSESLYSLIYLLGTAMLFSLVYQSEEKTVQHETLLHITRSSAEINLKTSIWTYLSLLHPWLVLKLYEKDKVHCIFCFWLGSRDHGR